MNEIDWRTALLVLIPVAALFLLTRPERRGAQQHATPMASRRFAWGAFSGGAAVGAVVATLALLVVGLAAEDPIATERDAAVAALAIANERIEAGNVTIRQQGDTIREQNVALREWQAFGADANVTIATLRTQLAAAQPAGFRTGIAQLDLLLTLLDELR